MVASTGDVKVSQELVHLFLGLLHAGECQLIDRGIPMVFKSVRNLPSDTAAT